MPTYKSAVRKLDQIILFSHLILRLCHITVLLSLVVLGMFMTLDHSFWFKSDKKYIKGENVSVMSNTEWCQFQQGARWDEFVNI